MPANLEKSALATGLRKISFHFIPKERQYQRMFQLRKIALISHASKVMLGYSQSQAATLWMFKLDLEKAKEPEIKLPTSPGS